MKSAGTGYDQTGNNAGYINLGGDYDGPKFDEADDYQAQKGGTFANLTEFLAQKKREEDADAQKKREEDAAAAHTNQINNNFEKDVPL